MIRRRTLVVLTTLALGLAGVARGQASPPARGAAADSIAAAGDEAATRAIIQRHLGRPYVWGAAGLKSYDCSGFVWRVMQERGTLIKRSTARKYFLALPRVQPGHRWDFGNIVFFSHLKHCGIVDTDHAFYHAGVIAGTSRARFDPLWRARISGVRAMPARAMREPREKDRP